MTLRTCSWLALLGGCTPIATFTVDGQVAYVEGELNASTPDRVRRVIAEHPELTTLILADVPGSLDDASAVEAGLLVREAGLATHVPETGLIASGGVDFFCAGSERTLAPGAQVGVHSWSDGRTEGSTLATDDPEHRLYTDYYDAMGIHPDFYWFTLDAAPSDGIHWMPPDELIQYELIEGSS